jgi:hypothetical protein
MPNHIWLVANAAMLRTEYSSVFFHIKYQPQDLLSQEIQHLWQQHISNPPGKFPLATLENYKGA